jgi:hypothetical protein
MLEHGDDGDVNNDILDNLLNTEKAGLKIDKQIPILDPIISTYEITNEMLVAQHTKHKATKTQFIKVIRDKEFVKLKQQVMSLSIELQTDRLKNELISKELKNYKSLYTSTREELLTLKLRDKDLNFQLASKLSIIEELNHTIKEIKEHYSHKFEQIIVDEETHRNALLEKFRLDQPRLFDEGISLTKYIETAPKNKKIILNHTNIFNQIQPLQVKSIKTPRSSLNDENKITNRLDNLKSDLLGYDTYDTYSIPPSVKTNNNI